VWLGKWQRPAAILAVCHFGIRIEKTPAILASHRLPFWHVTFGG